VTTTTTPPPPMHVCCATHHQAVVLTKRPQIAEASTQLDPGVLDLLVAQLSTLAAVYHQPPETFVPKLRRGQAQQAAEKLKQLKELNRAQSEEYAYDASALLVIVRDVMILTCARVARVAADLCIVLQVTMVALVAIRCWVISAVAMDWQARQCHRHRQ
jgi:hypothetical protein